MGAISIGELRGIITLSDQFSGPVGKVQSSLAGLHPAFDAITKVAAVTATAVAATTAAIVALGVRGATVDDVSSAFGALAEEAGSTADAMLGSLRTATEGTISDFDLMAAGTKALQVGLVKTSDDMGTLAAGARLLADRTGGDAKEALEDLTRAMATGRTTQLKQMGLFVETEAAVKSYAAKIGVATGDLSEMDKRTAISQATLAALKGELEKSGPVALDFGDRIEQVKVGFQNFTDSLGLAIATSPVVTAGMEAIGQALQNAFGSNQQETVATLTGFVNKFAIFLVDVADVAVVTAGTMVKGFHLAKIVFNTVLEAFSSGLGKFQGMLASLAEKAQELPVLGEQFKGVAEGMRQAADFANSLAFGFAEQKTQAQEALNGVTLFVDTTRTGLENVRAAMVAADGATVQMATTARTVLPQAFEEGAARSTVAATQLATTTAEVSTRMMEAMASAGEVIKTTAADTWGTAAAVAVSANDAIIAAANNAGFQTRAQLEATAASAKQLYDDMLASGQFTYGELEQAHAAYKAAENALNEESAISTMQKFELLAASASTILRSIFGKSKAAAIAAAIIDTAAAVAKALSAYPWPFNLAPAAAALAAGIAQVNKIRSTNAEGFRFGTGEGGRFRDFGGGTAAVLHDDEAVVTRGEANSVADMVMGAVRDGMRGGVGRGGGGVTHVVLQLNSRTLAEWWSDARHRGEVMV